MARLPRLVVPGLPHHVTRRGNRRERTFFEKGDYAALRWAETIGRPIGDAPWLKALEKRTGCALAPAKRGRKSQR
jgi:hypothetical protein